MQTKTLVRKEDYDNIHGVIIAKLPEWYFVREIRDFHFDSFSLIAADTVSRIRFNRYDKVTNEIFWRHESEKAAEPPITLEPDDSDEVIFQRIADLNQLVIVENEEPGESRFMIGKIHRITKHRLFMKYFGADGKWWTRPVGIDYWEITRVAFGGEYEKGWEGYFRDRKES